MLEATTRTASIRYDGKVLTTELFDDVVIEIEDAKENYRMVMDIIRERKFVSLVITSPHNSITREARESANTAENYKYCIAQAIVVKSLATRVLGNFFVRFAKQHCPHRLFQSREDALEWLNVHWDAAMKTNAA
ncbi:MAG TPA: hypothetical protein VGF30_05520 [Bacteroidia bacterium]